MKYNKGQSILQVVMWAGGISLGFVGSAYTILSSKIDTSGKDIATLQEGKRNTEKDITEIKTTLKEMQETNKQILFLLGDKKSTWKN